MPKIAKAMNDKQVQALLRKPDNKPHYVGGVQGLYLLVNVLKSGNVSATWYLRVEIDGKKSKKSLGQYPDITLLQARNKAAELREQFARGVNPFELEKEIKRQKKSKAKQKEKDDITFEGALSEYLDYKQERNWKHAESTRIKEERRIRNHLASLMPLALSAIEPEDVAAAVMPIWCTKAQTANRILGLIRGYFKWAMTVKKCRPRGINPAESQWIKDLLPPESKRKKEIPMPALSVDQLPPFMKALHERADTHLTALCLEFAILTCVRSNNVRSMRWEQLNKDLTLWEIDAAEMKIDRNGQHKIPLSKQAKAIIEKAKTLAIDPFYVFPSERVQGKPLSNSALNVVIRDLHAIEVKAGREGWIDRKQTKEEKKPRIAVQHGISRATFKTWAEGSRQDQRAVELILHHDIDPRLKSSYDRAEDIPHKAKVLQNWADFCYSEIEKK